MTSISLIGVKIQVESVGIPIRRVVTLYEVINFETEFVVKIHGRSPQRINVK